MENSHIVKKFDKNLDKIKAAILEMGEMVGQQIKDATTMLFVFDAGETDRIVLLDLRINGLHKEIYERAETLIARRQPVALDLRQTLSPINIAGELERIGDHAKSTAKRARILVNNPSEDEVYGVIAQMSGLVQVMLVDVLRAYETADIELAANIRERDLEVDHLNKKLLKMVIKKLSNSPVNAESLVYLVLISRNFERVGDHIANIARYVHQIETGEDVKASG